MIAYATGTNNDSFNAKFNGFLNVVYISNGF